ncbi:MAG: metallophosphoesterase [Bacteroidetes bacterium]|nr:MAG: metallophosphoesterase [Bacteroidota bacterium]
MHGFFLIIIIIISSLTIIDFYFSISLSRFLKKRNFKKFFRRLPVFISGFMVLLTISSFIFRTRDEAQTLTNKMIMYLVYFWYLPKLGIVLILLFKDIIKLSVKFLKYIKLKVIKKPPFSKGISGFPPEHQQEPKSLSRRKLAGNIAWSLAGVPFLIVGDNMLRNTYDFHIYPVQIPIAKLPPGLNGLKIVQISDIHAGSFLTNKTFINATILANAVQPDLIFVTGDFVNNHPDEMVLAVEGLKRLNAHYGVYACLGNHDHYMSDDNHKKLIKTIRNSGIDLLINENKKLNINGCNLQLAATDNTSWGDKFANFDKTLDGLNDIDPTILLCHDPNNWDPKINGKRDVDLMLAGHTHGGQFSFKIDGMELSPVRYVYKYYAGLYKNKDQYLYVNRGCGTAGPPIRIGMKPEITLITLVRPENVV